jgi:uncharacterized SAM-binding protein YcdF (DUF218 family)
VRWWGRKLAGEWQDPKGDVLVVLGGAASQDGILAAGSYWRSAYAVRAYREDGFKRVVLSGHGNPDPIAPTMGNYLRGHNIPPEAITIEDRSRNTRENALRTREVLQGVTGTVVLLTSDYHMFRAYRVFRKAGLEVRPRPIPDVTKRSMGWKGRWPAFLDLAEETVKIGYYYARGWI